MRDAKKHLHGGNFVKKADRSATGRCACGGRRRRGRRGAGTGNRPRRSAAGDDRRRADSLRTGENLRRMIAFFGHDLDAWVGAEVEAPASRRTLRRNPEESRMRKWWPVAAAVAETEALPAFISDLGGRRGGIGLPPPPRLIGNGPVSRTRQAARRLTQMVIRGWSHEMTGQDRRGRRIEVPQRQNRDRRRGVRQQAGSDVLVRVAGTRTCR